MRSSSRIHRGSAGRPRVVIDLEKVRHPNCGLGRFCRHLAEGILAAPELEIDPVLFLPPEKGRLRPTVRHFRDGAVEHIDVSPWRKETFARFLRPLVRPFRGDGPCDLWHVTSQASKYLPLDPRVPVVLTIHDLNFLHDERHRGRPAAVRRKLAAVQAKIDRAAALVTISRFVAGDVEARLDLRGKPLHIVPNGLPPATAAAPRRPDFLTPGPFLLTVGAALPHKNCHVLLGMIALRPDLRLVIAGRKATPYGAFLEEEVRRRRLHDRVFMPGEVNDGDRQWLYEHCDAFLFPSVTEGFGFPVLEAMQCGRPVFASRLTSLPEVAGDRAGWWDSFEPHAMLSVLQDGLEKVRSSPGFAAAQRAHAAAYTWDRAAAGYLRVYREVLERRAA
jgi:glycosyltransferase involved in cell wall biosynthesis